MNPDVIKYAIFGILGAIVIIGIVYYILRNNLQTKSSRYRASLMQGTKTSSFDKDIFYQKLYIFCAKIPLVRRYLMKTRRRLEILHLEDEYVTRKESAQIIFKSIWIFLIVLILIFKFTKGNFILRFSLIIFAFFFIEVIMEGMVDKIDNKLLLQQIEFFAEIRHAYHEFNMVEEAVYDVSQNDELSVSRQGEKIYEILIADDPEMELEKYYDIAPNSFLKEFAGISYLTKEYGDRKDKDGASLYLKNLNNITQEMQIEILKRDKLDYVFQSLSIIASMPILAIEMVKNWAITNFSFTAQFYNGSVGFVIQMLMIAVTFICFILVRKLKDNGSVNTVTNSEHPWQEKLYKNKLVKKVVDYFMPKTGTKEFRNVNKLLKDAASKLKIEWFYENRLAIALLVLGVSVALFNITHFMKVRFIYTEPTSNYNLLGNMSDAQERKAKELTESDNKYLDLYRYDETMDSAEKMESALYKTDEYGEKTVPEVKEAAERIFEKIMKIRKAYFQWYELLISFVLMVGGYYAPIALLVFQRLMRQMEMENEVMQFQTIILMLMKIERVNIEMILEWLERYSNIFREPISKCVNNYESGAWEALEELKKEITFEKLIRIVEGLQAAVEHIPIRQAFDELDTERAYYQEKRKETNERLISKKALIGKIIGFAPMVGLFVGYLIIPLVVIGMTSMTEAFTTMSTMA